MTTIRKIAVIAVAAVAILTAVYQANQARDARSEAQNLWAKQSQLARQIADLQDSLANATNQLASLLEENARLKNHSNELELLKLRSEVTRLRPLQEDVVALQKKLQRSSGNLVDWKTNDLEDAGRADPIDALRTYLYLSQNFNPDKIQNGVVGDDTDPPDKDELQNFIKSESNHPRPTDGIADYKILSQTQLSPDKVEVELNVTFGDSRMGISTPFTLQNINGEWKLVVFNVRDGNGKLNHLSFVNESPVP